MRKGWFSRQQELEAGEKIRQTKLEISATRDQYMRTKEGFLIVLLYDPSCLEFIFSFHN